MSRKPKPTIPPRISGLSYDNGKPFVSGVELISGTQYTITATVNAQTKSVKWNRDGTVVKTDSAAPFDYTWTPSGAVGPHTYVVTPFSATNATGTVGPAVTINWTLKAAPVPPATASAFVSWTQVATATGYKISWGESTRNYTYEKDAGANLTLEVPNLTKGTAYYFSGKAYNTAGDSTFGNEVRFVP